MSDDQTTRVVIKGIGRYDGEYELDTDRAFNAREWRWVKQISGYKPMTLDEGLRGGDPDVFIAMAVIAMARSYKIERDEALDVAERLSEAPFDGATIQIITPTETEDDDLPLASPSLPDGSSSNGTGSKPNGTEETSNDSGETSRTSSVRLDATLPVTGTTGSDGPSTSDPTTQADSPTLI